MNSDAEDQPLSPCAEKLAFDTKQDAEATATVAAYRYGGARKPYKCSHCGLWHLATDYEN